MNSKVVYAASGIPKMEMEPDTSQKNGAIPKSLTSKKNIFLQILIAVFLMAIAQNANAQTFKYIWPPPKTNYSQTDSLKGKSIGLEIEDARIKKFESKIPFDEISNAIFDAITQTYGNSFINSESDIKVILFVQIYETAANIGLITAKLTGQTRYAVKIKDKVETVEQIIYLQSGPVKANAACEKVLNESFVGANMKLFQFFNENLKF